MENEIPIETKSEKQKLPSDDLQAQQSHRKAGFWDVLCFGICAVIGPHFDLWNRGLSAGFWHFFYIVIAVGICYLILVLCIQEMSSALPFSGGAYGLEIGHSLED